MVGDDEGSIGWLWKTRSDWFSLVRPPGGGRDAHGGKFLRLARRDRSEGGEGDRRQGHGVVLRAGQLVDHGVHHHLPLPLRLDGRTEAELWTVSKVGVAGGRVCWEKSISLLTWGSLYKILPSSSSNLMSPGVVGQLDSPSISSPSNSFNFLM